MHILFLHNNFPAQFGQVAATLVREHGYRCTFLNSREGRTLDGIECVQFQPDGATSRDGHFSSLTFENQIRRTSGAELAMVRALQEQPDRFRDLQLIVAHSGFVSSLFLAETFPDVPVVGYFEYYYHRQNSDFDFRKDLPQPGKREAMRLRARNAMLLLDLQHCQHGYCPTEFQRSRFPSEYQPKLDTIFDGIDLTFWKAHPLREEPLQIGDLTIRPDQQLITFVSRGFESMRGGDLFLRVAHRVCQSNPNAVVVAIGEDRVAYGGDLKFTEGQTFRDWSIRRHAIDLERIHFVGRLAPRELTRVLSRSDIHLYWTVPFVLSWSMLNAMACECCVVGSDTEPVREMIQHDKNGYLVDFFDVDAWVATIEELLQIPERRRELGQNARALVEERYALPDCLERMRKLYERVVKESTPV